jgi:hypothetical protein
MANITINIEVVSSLGFALTTSQDLNFSTGSILVNWNSKNINSYDNFNLGVLQQRDPYINSIIYDGLPADNIVIESFQDDIILANSFNPWSTPIAIWSPPPVGYIQKQLLDSSNNPIVLPYTISVSGNAPVDNIGLKVNTVSGELKTPTTVGTPYSTYPFAFRRMIIGYKIYSGGVAQTDTIYFMWYTGTVVN